MRCWVLGAIVSLIAVAHAESQPRQPGVNGVPIRVRSGGNELVVVREAPVAYARLDQLVVDIARPAEPGAAPIRIVRAPPQQLLDYVLCVTRDGTLVAAPRTATFDPGERRTVHTNGAREQ